MHRRQCACWRQVTHFGILLAPCDLIHFVTSLRIPSRWMRWLKWIFGQRGQLSKTDISIGVVISILTGNMPLLRFMCRSTKTRCYLILTKRHSKPNLCSCSAGPMELQIYHTSLLGCFRQNGQCLLWAGWLAYYV